MVTSAVDRCAIHLAELEPAGRKAEIAADQIRTISKLRLGRRIDSLDVPTASRLQLITEIYGD